MAAMTIGASAIDMATRDRNVGGAQSDANLRTQINMLWFENCPRMHRNITISVKNGQVVLSGMLDDRASKLKALAITWQVEGVFEIIDDLKIKVQKVTDAQWAEEQIIEALKSDNSLSASRFSIVAFESKIYVLGKALTLAEKKRVLSITHNVGGSCGVIDKVTVLN